MNYLEKLTIVSENYQGKTSPVQDEVKFTYNGAAITIQVIGVTVKYYVNTPTVTFSDSQEMMTPGSFTWNEIIEKVLAGAMVTLTQVAVNELHHHRKCEHRHVN